MDDEQLTVTTTRDADRAVVALAGELDVNTASQVADALGELAGENPLTSVVVDVSRLSFVDSTGLRVILAGRESLQALGATLTLDGASGVVERVLEMTGLRGLLAQQS
jgi:anti-anti-sigma factor